MSPRKGESREDYLARHRGAQRVRDAARREEKRAYQAAYRAVHREEIRAYQAAYVASGRSALVEARLRVRARIARKIEQIRDLEARLGLPPSTEVTPA